MEEYISRREYEEHNKRMEDEHARSNARIRRLEDASEQISGIATSVEKLAVSIEQMAKAQEKQGEKLEKLEGRDGQRWREVVGYVITAVLGIVLGLVANWLGLA